MSEPSKPPVNPHAAFRQLQRELHIDDQGRSYRPHLAVQTKDCEVVCTIVYDLKNPDPAKRVRYEYPNRS